jgi:hypothetical protein
MAEQVLHPTESDDEANDELGDDDGHPADDATASPSWLKQYPAQYLPERSGHANGQTPTHFVYGNALTLERDLEGPRLRLLRLRPGTRELPIQGDLIVRPVFEGNISYIALSYSWGTHAKTQTVFLGASRTSFNISPHLHAALRHLQDQERCVDVWVDAICINQENDLERTAQVQIMAQIYSQADEVRIWLGMDDYVGVDDDDVIWALCQQEHAWWRRLWVVQECAYAEKCPVVSLAQKEISLQDFVERWTAIVQRYQRAYDHLHRRTSLQENLHFVQQLLDVWKERNDAIVRLPLLTRLRQTAKREYTIPHDRVYAILSLVDEEEGRAIVPDYRRSYSSLRATVEALVRRSPDWNADQDDALLTDANMDAESESHPGTTVATSSNTKSVRTDEPAGAPLPFHHPAVLAALQDPRGLEVQKASEARKLPLESRPNADMEKALRVASANGDMGSAKLLLKSGAVSDTQAALQAASAGGQASMAKLLLDHGADVNAFGDRDVEPPLVKAACGGHSAVVELLLSQSDIDVNLGDVLGRTPLSCAAQNGHVGVVGRLLAKPGIDVNRRDMYGDTPLSHATRNRHLAVVKLLLAREDIDAGSHDGHSGTPPSTAGQDSHAGVSRGGRRPTGRSRFVRDVKTRLASFLTREREAGRHGEPASAASQKPGHVPDQGVKSRVHVSTYT